MNTRLSKQTLVGLAVAGVLIATLRWVDFAPAASAQGTDAVARGKHLVDIMGCNDCHTPWHMGPNGPEFLSNHAGGILGGISSGQPVTARVAFKPTSSILTLRRSINADGEEIDLRTKGRHDPCVGIRAVPVVEAMVACVLADAFLRHRGQTGG